MLGLDALLGEVALLSGDVAAGGRRDLDVGHADLSRDDWRRRRDSPLGGRRRGRGRGGWGIGATAARRWRPRAAGQQQPSSYRGEGAGQRWGPAIGGAAEGQASSHAAAPFSRPVEGSARGRRGDPRPRPRVRPPSWHGWGRAASRPACRAAIDSGAGLAHHLPLAVGRRRRGRPCRGREWTMTSDPESRHGGRGDAPADDPTPRYAVRTFDVEYRRDGAEGFQARIYQPERARAVSGLDLRPRRAVGARRSAGDCRGRERARGERARGLRARLPQRQRRAPLSGGCRGRELRPPAGPRRTRPSYRRRRTASAAWAARAAAIC